MYHPYRGRRAQRRRVLRDVLIALLSLFIVACIIFLLFFQNTSTITLFGHTLTLPGRGQTQEKGETAQKQHDKVDFQVVEDRKDAAQPQTPAVTQPTATRTIEIPADKLADSAYLAQAAQLKTSGKLTNAAIMVKDATGAVVSADTLKVPLATLKAAGFKTTAIVYTFQDNAYAKQTTAAALKNVDKKSWRLPDGKRWLDPASTEAMQYLTAQVQACKDAGFDEVVLRAFGYPTEGSLGRIVYGDAYATPAARADLLAQRLTELATAAAPVKVSVVVDDPTAENGLNQKSAQDVAKLYKAANAVYAPMEVQSETSGDSIRAIVGKLTGGDTAKLVPMYTSAALAPTLFAGDSALYFTPSETSGALTQYLAQ
ncbi:MAG: hypothetical protein EOM63_02355 [Clostridia bacterium]|nr:hypothetical protein [Clostridia bacterium]